MHMLSGKPFSVLSKCQQRRKKATLKASITNCLNSCKAANGLKSVSVTLKTEDNRKINLECMNVSSEDKENQSSITDVEGVRYQSPKSILVTVRVKTSLVHTTKSATSVLYNFSWERSTELKFAMLVH